MDGNDISSYQMKIQPSVELSNFALEEQVANQEDSWEIDSKASFPPRIQPPMVHRSIQVHYICLHLTELFVGTKY